MNDTPYTLRQDAQHVICDLDGTLALNKHREHHIKQDPPDWRAFFAACRDDEPNWPVIQLVRTLSAWWPVTIVSGRSDEVAQDSIEWLHRWGVPFTMMVMRREGDHRPDDELKKEFMVDNGWTPENTLCVIDDRDKVVRMWRDFGFTCLQVADGGF